MSSINITPYVIGFLVIVLLIYFGYQEYKIDRLKLDKKQLILDIDRLKLDKLLKEEEAQKCFKAIENQNKEIEFVERMRADALADLEKWKNKPPKVRYEVIYKTIGEPSDECNDTKSVLDAVRSLDPNGL